jgi:hypothetical protein
MIYRRVGMARHPCKECLLKTICSELCEEVMEDNNGTGILEFIREHRCCPDCGGTRLVGCGGEILRGNKVFADSSASCIDCGSLFFRHIEGSICMGRHRKHRKIVKDPDYHPKVTTFWEYLYNNKFISEREHDDG